MEVVETRKCHFCNRIYAKHLVKVVDHDGDLDFICTRCEAKLENEGLIEEEARTPYVNIPSVQIPYIPYQPSTTDIWTTTTNATYGNTSGYATLTYSSPSLEQSDENGD